MNTTLIRNRSKSDKKFPAFRERLSIAMKLKEISTAQLAAELGVSLTVVNRWRKGGMPRASILNAISQRVGKSVEWLLGDGDEHESSILTDDTFEGRLKMCMRERGYTTSSLATAADVAPSTIAKWWSGCTPHATSIKKLADILGVSVEWLLNGTGEKTPAFETELDAPYFFNAIRTLLDLPKFATGRDIVLAARVKSDREAWETRKLNIRIEELEAVIERLTAKEAVA